MRKLPAPQFRTGGLQIGNQFRQPRFIIHCMQARNAAACRPVQFELANG